MIYSTHIYTKDSEVRAMLLEEEPWQRLQMIPEFKFEVVVQYLLKYPDSLGQIYELPKVIFAKETKHPFQLDSEAQLKYFLTFLANFPDEYDSDMDATLQGLFDSHGFRFFDTLDLEKMSMIPTHPLIHMICDLIGEMCMDSEFNQYRNQICFWEEINPILKEIDPNNDDDVANSFTNRIKESFKSCNQPVIHRNILRWVRREMIYRQSMQYGLPVNLDLFEVRKKFRKNEIDRLYQAQSK